jgi:hypothetical protein
VWVKSLAIVVVPELVGAMPVWARRLALKHIDDEMHRADAAVLGYRDDFDLLADAAAPAMWLRFSRFRPPPRTGSARP